jgi:hypothetical protein
MTVYMTKSFELGQSRSADHIGGIGMAFKIQQLNSPAIILLVFVKNIKNILNRFPKNHKYTLHHILYIQQTIINIHYIRL